GYQHGGEAEIRIAAWIGEAHLDALALRARRDRDAARGRAVARRVGEQHGRFEAWNQALVAVGERVGEGIDRLRVLDDATDVMQAHLGQIRVAIAGEQRLLALPDRLVHVHARAV